MIQTSLVFVFFPSFVLFLCVADSQGNDLFIFLTKKMKNALKKEKKKGRSIDYLNYNTKEKVPHLD